MNKLKECVIKFIENLKITVFGDREAAEFHYKIKTNYVFAILIKSF